MYLIKGVFSFTFRTRPEINSRRVSGTSKIRVKRETSISTLLARCCTDSGFEIGRDHGTRVIESQWLVSDFVKGRWSDGQ